MNGLFSGKEVGIVFEKATLKQTKDGGKVARLTFAIRLEADVLLNAPAEIRAAYEAVETLENGITIAELGDKEIGGVNIEFAVLPQSKSISLALQSVTLTKLRVERGAHEGISAPHLFCTMQIPVEDNKAIRYWIVDNVFLQLWAKLEAAQMVLAPSIPDTQSKTTDAKGKVQ